MKPDETPLGPVWTLEGTEKLLLSIDVTFWDLVNRKQHHVHLPFTFKDDGLPVEICSEITGVVSAGVAEALSREFGKLKKPTGATNDQQRS